MSGKWGHWEDRPWLLASFSLLQDALRPEVGAGCSLEMFALESVMEHDKQILLIILALYFILVLHLYLLCKIRCSMSLGNSRDNPEIWCVCSWRKLLKAMDFFFIFIFFEWEYPSPSGVHKQWTLRICVVACSLHLKGYI